VRASRRPKGPRKIRPFVAHVRFSNGDLKATSVYGVSPDDAAKRAKAEFPDWSTIQLFGTGRSLSKEWIFGRGVE